MCNLYSYSKQKYQNEKKTYFAIVIWHPMNKRLMVQKDMFYDLIQAK